MSCTEKNYDKAYEWTYKAASKDHKKAKVNLGILYYHGKGTKVNYDLSLSYLRESALEYDKLAIDIIIEMANKSFFEAQEFLGIMYYEGYGVEQDVEEAFKWFESAAKQKFKYPKAKYYLGMMYKYGDGVDENIVLANKWFSKAFDIFQKDSKKGDRDAKYYLALMFYEGYSINQDYLKAFEIFHELACNDYADAQYYLGLMYYNGEGLEKDYRQAFEWYCKAAENGDTDAQYDLGNMYHDGIGVDKDYEKALGWYLKAAAKGHDEAMEIIQNMYGGQ